MTMSWVELDDETSTSSLACISYVYIYIINRYTYIYIYDYINLYYVYICICVSPRCTVKKRLKEPPWPTCCTRNWKSRREPWQCWVTVLKPNRQPTSHKKHLKGLPGYESNGMLSVQVGQHLNPNFNRPLRKKWTKFVWNEARVSKIRLHQPAHDGIGWRWLISQDTSTLQCWNDPNGQAIFPCAFQFYAHRPWKSLIDCLILLLWLL